MLVSLLMTVVDRQLRTAPARVNFSISSDKATGATIDQHDRHFGPKELTP
jgi:hypothetical protein